MKKSVSARGQSVHHHNRRTDSKRHASSSFTHAREHNAIRHKIFFYALLAVFLIAILISSVYAPTFFTRVSGDFDEGTYDQTEYNMGDGAVELIAGQNTGTYTSKVFDGETTQTVWDQISWVSGTLYGQALLDNQGTENVSRPLPMENNVLLLHFNALNGEGTVGDTSSLDLTTLCDLQGLTTETLSAAWDFTCPEFTEGKFDNAGHFDGVWDVVIVENDERINFNATHDFAISVWVNAPFGNPNTNDQHILEKWWYAPGNPNPLGYPYTIRLRSGIVRAVRFDHNVSHVTLLTSITNLSDSTWHHIAYVKNGTELNLYIDGFLEDTDTDLSVEDQANNLSTLSNGNITIGNRWRGLMTQNLSYTGLIDEVAIWNATLTAEQVQDLYIRGLTHFNLSVRSCDDSACDGEAWDETYSSSPNTLAVPNNRYFQYRADFSSEDATLSAELYNVTIEYYEILAPNATFVNPTSAQQITDHAPVIQVQFNDSNSGLHPSGLNLSLDTFLYVNGVNLTCTPNVANMTGTLCTVNAPTLTAGAHTITARVADTQANSAVSAITFTIIEVDAADDSGTNDDDRSSSTTSTTTTTTTTTEEAEVPSAVSEESLPTETSEEATQATQSSESLESEDSQSEVQSSEQSEESAASVGSSNDGRDVDSDGAVFEGEGHQFDLEVSEISLGWTKLYKDGVLLKDLVLKDNDELTLELELTNNGKQNIDDLKVSVDDLPYSITASINPLAGPLTPGKKGTIAIHLKAQSVDEPFTFYVTLQNSYLLRTPIHVILEDEYVIRQQLQREKVIRETRTVITTSYKWILLITLLPLLFFFHITTFADVETTRRLVKTKHVGDYGRVYSTPLFKEAETVSQVRTLQLTPQEMNEAQYLVQKYKIDYELASLVLHANKHLFPRVLTTKSVPVQLKKRYKHVFFIDMQQKLNETELLHYIHTHKARGFAEREIYHVLLKAGWSKKVLTKHMNPLKEIKKDVHQKVKNGVSFEQICAELQEEGWTREEIEREFKLLSLKQKLKKAKSL